MKLKLLASILLFLGLTACAQVTLTLPYSPQSTEELAGAVTVNEFRYFPSEGIAQNEIRETAIGRVFLTESVGTFLKGALRRELRQSGVSLKSAKCEIEGEVNEFLIDSLGYSSDYKTDIRYILYGSDKKVLFDNSYVVQFNASKFVTMDVIFANINKAVADNINQLITDPYFVQALETKCPKG